MKTSKDTLEKVYLIAKIVAAASLATFLFSYSSFSTQHTLEEWESEGTLIRVNNDTGQAQYLVQKGQKYMWEDKEFLWRDLGSPPTP